MKRYFERTFVMYTRIFRGFLPHPALAAALLIMSAALLPAQEKPIPSGGVSLIGSRGVEAFRTGSAAGGEATLVAVEGQTFSRALRLRTKTRPDNDYNLQTQARTTAAVTKGDNALAVISVRALETSDEMGEATLTFVFEKAGAPYSKSAEYQIKTGREWKKYFIPFVIQENYAAGRAQCNLRFGYRPQTVEVGGVEILSFGRTVKIEDLPKTIPVIKYQGREPDALWRKAAAERIEKYRKGDLTLTVRDSRGRPIQNAAVAVGMKRHAYGFGAAVTARLLTIDSEDGRKYRTIVEENFNKVVFENDLKLGPWALGKTTSPTANYNMENTLTALQWCQDRGLLVRGHTLLWGPLDKRFYQKQTGFDIDSRDWGKMKQLLMAHVEEKVGKTGDFVTEWDALNHPVATWGDQGRTWETVLGPGFYADLLKRARALNPRQLLYVNEGSDFPGDNEAVRSAYEKLVHNLLAAGAPLDGIGFMSHFGESSLTGMDNIYALLERFSRFGLNLQSTELDVGTAGDEEAQADYYRDFMTMFFSHPSTVGIVMWGFWEGAHWYPERALYRKNWEIKPCGRVWLDLVKKQWWTDAAGKTDAAGACKIRGFFGDYEVTVTAAGKSKTVILKLEKNGMTQAIVFE
jgi:endo-1,4-beta-xylanase